nr:MAG TPA: ribosome, CHIMERIC HYBRID STATE RIBOSOME.5A [Crassvirales sp.]
MIRITIDDNKEVEIKTTKGLEETELASNAAIEILRNMVDRHKPKGNEKCDLVLTWVDQNCKLSAVKEIKENLDFWLKEAKDSVDSYLNNGRTILATGNRDVVEKLQKRFDSSKYVKVCVLEH